MEAPGLGRSPAKLNVPAGAGEAADTGHKALCTVSRYVINTRNFAYKSCRQLPLHLNT